MIYFYFASHILYGGEGAALRNLVTRRFTTESALHYVYLFSLLVSFSHSPVLLFCHCLAATRRSRRISRMLPSAVEALPIAELIHAHCAPE